MVTILPPKFNLGDQIGGALQQGFQKGFDPAIQQQYQRGQLQAALSKAKAVAQEKGSSSLDTAFALMEAGAGIPGSERYLSTLLPMLMGKQRADQIFGDEALQDASQGVPGAPSPRNALANPNNIQGRLPVTGVPASSLTSGLPEAREPTQTGVLPQIMTPAEIQARAENAARASNDPNSVGQWQQYYSNQSQLATNQRKNMSNLALEQGVNPSDLPEFMQIGQRYGYMTNPEDWARATKRDFDSYRTNKDQLETAFVPGFFTGLVKGPKAREDSLKNLTKPVKALVDQGFEQQVRKKLASEYLSPTEIEEVIHPLTPEVNKALKNAPSAPFFEENRLFEPTPGGAFGGILEKRGIKTFEEVSKKNPQIINQMNKNLGKWLRQNVTETTPLSVIRHRLVKEKGYDWRQFGPALDLAIKDGLKLSEAQGAELSEINTQPPRDSLSEIFSDWPRAIQYLRGNK